MHELQQILLQKLPRLQLPTSGCKIRKGKAVWSVIGITREEDEIGEVLLYRQQGHDDIGVTYLMSREVLLHDRTVEILGHPFTPADILEALGEDFVMSGNYQIYATTDSSISDNCYPYFTNGCRLAINYVDKYNDKYTFPKLPSNISDLSLPEYEETRKQLIQLLMK